MLIRILTLTPIRPVIEENGTMTQEFRDWVQAINDQTIIIGTGSPEGVVEALPGQEFMDDAGATGSIKYIKQKNDIAGDKTKGWILI